MKYEVADMVHGRHARLLDKLWREEYPEYFEERLDWLYHRNPAGNTITVVAGNDELDRLIGTGSLIVRQVYYRDSVRKTYIAADFFIDPKHRVFGPALKIQRCLTAKFDKKDFDFIFAFPNKDARKIFSRIGYKVLGEADQYVRIIRSEYQIKKKVQEKSFAAWLACFADTALLLADMRMLFWEPRGATFQVIDRANAFFDILWDVAKKDYAIIGVKNAAYLNWRYDDFKGAKYQYFTMSDRQKRPIGYILFENQGKTALIKDVCCLKPGRFMLKLLLAFSRYIRRQGMWSVRTAYFGNSEIERILLRAGFLKLGKKRNCMVFCEYDAQDQKQLFDKEKWCLFDGEFDI